MTRSAPSSSSGSISGISNYHTDSDRSVQNRRSLLALRLVDYCEHSRAQYAELRIYLADYLSDFSGSRRPKINLGLPNLSNMHCYEFSTDIYEEVVRRNSDNKFPFLQERVEFHPKRNAARKRMATLSSNRMKELSNEIFVELGRRYPQLRDGSQIMNPRLTAEGCQSYNKENELQLQRLTEQLNNALQRVDEQSAATLTVSRELKTLRQAHKRQVHQSYDDQKQIVDLHTRCDRLEAENESYQQQIELVKAEKINDIEILQTLINELSALNAELTSAKELDSTIIYNLKHELQGYKETNRQSDAELDDCIASKSLSIIDIQKSEDEDKVLVNLSAPDIHIALFNSAIDDLLKAGRSNQSRRVVFHLEQAADAVANILQDIKAFSRRPWRYQSETNVGDLLSLRARAWDTLDDLTAVTKTYISSSGKLPFSSVEDATFPISATITEIGQYLYIPQAAMANDYTFPSLYTKETPSRAPWPATALQPMDGSQTANTPSTRNTTRLSTSSPRGRIRESSSSLTLDLEQCFNRLRQSWSDHWNSDLAGSPARSSIAVSSDISEKAEKLDGSIPGSFRWPYLEAQRNQ